MTTSCSHYEGATTLAPARHIFAQATQLTFHTLYLK